MTASRPVVLAGVFVACAACAGGPEIPVEPGGGAVSGRVHLDRRQDVPLADARVQLVRDAVPLGETVSGADGRYRLGPYAAGAATLHVTAAGYLPAESDVTLVEGGDTVVNVGLRVDTVVPEVGDVTVSVREAGPPVLDGPPTEGPTLAGAEVSINFNGRVVATEVSDAAGRARFRGLRAGPAEVVATLEGYEPGSRRVGIVPDQVVATTVLLSRATEGMGESAIVVVGARYFYSGDMEMPPNTVGRLPFATVVLRGGDGTEVGTLTDGEGRAGLSLPAPGLYEASVTHEQFVPQLIPVAVLADRRTELVFILESTRAPPGVLLGQVYEDAGEEGWRLRPDALLRFTRPDGALAAVARASDLGLYDLRGLAVGTYVVIASHTQTETVTDSLIVDQSDAALLRDFVLPRAEPRVAPPPVDTVHGLVFARGGAAPDEPLAPLAGGQVRRLNSLGDVVAITGPDGSFQAAIPSEEGASLAFVHADFFPQHIAVAPRPGEAMFADALLWPRRADAPPAVLSGEAGTQSVTDGATIDFDPVAATIEVSPIEDPARPVARAAHLPGTPFVVEVPPGEYIVFATSPGLRGELPPLALQPGERRDVRVVLEEIRGGR